MIQQIQKAEKKTSKKEQICMKYKKQIKMKYKYKYKIVKERIKYKYRMREMIKYKCKIVKERIKRLKIFLTKNKGTHEKLNDPSKPKNWAVTDNTKRKFDNGTIIPED